MKVFKYLLISILYAGLFSCTNQTNNSSQKKFHLYEDSVLNSKSFIEGYSELPPICSEYLIDKISLFYIHVDSSKKTEGSVFELKALLFPQHYSKNESDDISKYALFIYHENDTSLFFFGINRRTSDFLFLNELTLDKSGGTYLTKEEHFVWNTEFDVLLENKCLELDLFEGSIYTESYHSLATFESQEENLWVIDSIQYSAESFSVFNVNDTFRVVNNQTMLFDNKKIDFSLDQSLKLFMDGDTTIARIVSYAETARIIQEETNGATYTFMHRVKL